MSSRSNIFALRKKFSKLSKSSRRVNKHNVRTTAVAFRDAEIIAEGVIEEEVVLEGVGEEGEEVVAADGAFTFIFKRHTLNLDQLLAPRHPYIY